MSFEDRGIYIDLLAMAWDSEEPGSFVLPLPGYNPRTVRSFLLRWPSTFVSTGAERNPNVTPTQAERRLKSGRKEAEKYLKFTNKKLHKQYLNLKEISEKRRLAAESRYHANAPANAPANDQSAFAVASASASAPNPTTTQDQVAVAVAPETAAAVKSVFDILQTNPFGSPAFQEIFVAQSKNGAKSWVDVMEHTIQECRSRKVGIPGRFYKIKHVLEKLDAEQSFKRKPL
jgi:hypothetical protein